MYRVVPAEDGSWSVLGYEWLVIDGNDRRSAVGVTRTAVAARLGVERDALNMETRKAQLKARM